MIRIYVILSHALTHGLTIKWLNIIHIYISIQVVWLVVSTPLKNMKVSWDYEIANIWKNMEK